MTDVTPEATPETSMAKPAVAGTAASLIADLQRQIDELRAERPAPPNEVSAAVKDLVDHVAARAAQYPAVNFGEVRSALLKVAAESVVDAVAHPEAVTAYIKEVVHELADMHPAHEFAYLKSLATGLHKTNLKVLAAA